MGICTANEEKNTYVFVPPIDIGVSVYSFESKEL